jgi:hypothetical protein
VCGRSSSTPRAPRCSPSAAAPRRASAPSSKARIGAFWRAAQGWRNGVEGGVDVSLLAQHVALS